MTEQLESLAQELRSQKPNITFTMADEGGSGAYFVEKDGKPVAVFKDASQDTICPENQRLHSKLMKMVVHLGRPLGVFSALEHSISGQAYVSDILSFRLAKEIGLKYTVVPPTTIAEAVIINGKAKKGVLIDWVPNPTSLEKFSNLFKKLEQIPEKIPLVAFEEMAMFDYVTGNMDRKAGNVLLSERDNKLYLIDNSWAFSPLQGEALSSNQYIWGTFPALADKKFSEETKSKIRDIYEKRYQYAQLAFQIYCEAKPPEETVELSYQRAICCLHRIEMMHHLICRKNATFHQLGQTRFEDDFLRIHQSNPSLFSSHFIDLNTQCLTKDGIRNQSDFAPRSNYLTPSEKRCAQLYGPLSESQNKLCKALYIEMVRLNEKQAYRNWSGLWRNRYKLKANAVNDAFEHLQQDSAQGSIEVRVKQSMTNKDSELYRALNTHTSFFFKVTLSSLSFDTQATINLRNAM